MTIGPSTIARASLTRKSIMATPMPIETTETGTPPTDPVKVVKPRGEVSSATEDGSSSSSRSLRAREREPTVTMRDASSPFFRPR